MRPSRAPPVADDPEHGGGRGLGGTPSLGRPRERSPLFGGVYVLVPIWLVAPRLGEGRARCWLQFGRRWRLQDSKPSDRVVTLQQQPVQVAVAALPIESSQRALMRLHERGASCWLQFARRRFHTRGAAASSADAVANSFSSYHAASIAQSTRLLLSSDLVAYCGSLVA